MKLVKKDRDELF